MGIAWKDFEMPKKLTCDESTYSDTYGKFKVFFLYVFFKLCKTFAIFFFSSRGDFDIFFI